MTARLLSNFTFKFNLRRYMEAKCGKTVLMHAAAANQADVCSALVACGARINVETRKVGRCRLNR
jgi:hypothetical protein